MAAAERSLLNRIKIAPVATLAVFLAG